MYQQTVFKFGRTKNVYIKNWAVWLHEYLKTFRSTRCFKIYLNGKRAKTKDNDFTWEEFQSRNNNELVTFMVTLLIEL